MQVPSTTATVVDVILAANPGFQTVTNRRIFTLFRHRRKLRRCLGWPPRGRVDARSSGKSMLDFAFSSPPSRLRLHVSPSLSLPPLLCLPVPDLCRCGSACSAPPLQLCLSCSRFIIKTCIVACSSSHPRSSLLSISVERRAHDMHLPVVFHDFSCLFHT